MIISLWLVVDQTNKPNNIIIFSVDSIKEGIVGLIVSRDVFKITHARARTRARRACSRGVIGSTVGAYPRCSGLNPVEGNGHFFLSCRQLYISSFSDTHARTHTYTHTQLVHVECIPWKRLI